jgi:uncharacterized protein (TIGR02246 family)
MGTMTGTMDATWGTATEILANAGVDEVSWYYGPFDSENEKAVLTVPMRIQAAWAAKDADAFADVFAETGSLLQYDDELTSREEIRRYMKAGFDGPFLYSEVMGRPLAMRFLGDDVALVVELAGVLLPGETEVAAERQFYATWVIRRREAGELELLSFQVSPIAS